jgi:predicted AAA+ superfamily ATPase
MAMTNHERIGKALDLLKEGLAPFVERELTAEHGQDWLRHAQQSLGPGLERQFQSKDGPAWDAASLLSVMWNQWNLVFKKTLGQAERTLVSELRDVRNRWAHQSPFSSDDTYRALDSAARLLAAVSAPQGQEVEKMRMELLRLRFDEQVRSERRKTAGTTVESGAAASLKPWREVVTPHRDVASGRYQQAEFAADLWQVHLGEGTSEYRDPAEFFRRTYLTESLNRLLVGAVRRLAGQGGDPVVQLQTNFGGGKTHSMLALYHLFSGVQPNELAGVEGVMKEAGLPTLSRAKTVVLVGNRISPGNPVTKPDGTVIRTLWGETAWQLGGEKAFARLAADDERATSPGDVLRELFKEYGPCLILIDEWVAYARQLHDQSDLPAGSFETQFTFAQALTESAKLANNCLLVISLPASDTAMSPHAQADDVEVGGQRGREALARLRNVVGRLESSWRPASAEEGFEIVRRRLFEPMTDPAQFKDRDVVARAFSDLYRTHRQEFPSECGEADYERRIKAAYPIHPEVFDRLYTDWSTLVKFQRTRGVLRLMASVIHSLWEKGDRNPLIQPANIPIDDPRVQFELTRYLSDNWVPVIEKDVDGPNALPLRIDGEQSATLGRLQATRRVARTIYLGSAPTASASHRGVEDRTVKLGCAMPGESPAVFGDALRRLGSAATYLYQDGTRFWYSTQPTVTKLAEDRAEELRRNPDKVAQELEKRLRSNLNARGDFSRVHPLPQSGQDVPDDLDARLVVLGPEHPYSKEAGSPAEKAARAIFESRGNAPRRFQNTVVFLAPDQTRLQDLDDALRHYLAWESILADRELLDLSPHQVRQAETQRDGADGSVTARLPETYQWLLVPVQGDPRAKIEWRASRLSGQDALAVRAGRKLRNDELLVGVLAGTVLRREIDKIPLWRDDHVSVRQLEEDFGSYVYLPRLVNSGVLHRAIEAGVSLLTWFADSFAYADSLDEETGRYRGLRAGRTITVQDRDPGLVVRPEVAGKQIEAEQPRAQPEPDGGIGPTPPDVPTRTITPPHVDTEPGHEPKPGPRRFHGSIELDPVRMGRDAGKIADEVIAHLAGLVGSKVKVTLEIEAELQEGAPEHVVRTVTENCRTLKFETLGFEEE